MFKFPLRPSALGASAILLAGIAGGCRHVHTDGSCANHECAKTAIAIAGQANSPSAPAVTTTPTPAPTQPLAAAPAPAPMRSPGTIAVKPVPIENLPPVTSEKSVPPADSIEILSPPPAAVVGPSKPEAAKPSTPTELPAKAEFDHSVDYAMLTGELSYSPIKNQWRLRYCSIAEEDRYGGSVTLDAGQELREFESGQFVRVQGEIVDKNSREPSPRYRVRNIVLVK